MVATGAAPAPGRGVATAARREEVGLPAAPSPPPGADQGNQEDPPASRPEGGQRPPHGLRILARAVPVIGADTPQEATGCAHQTHPASQTRSRPTSATRWSWSSRSAGRFGTPCAILEGCIELVRDGKPRADARSGGAVLLLADQHHEEHRDIHDKG